MSRKDDVPAGARQMPDFLDINDKVGGGLADLAQFGGDLASAG